jgi:hypothetical protein
VVKDDGSNKIKNEKYICQLSKEEKAFIEQSRVIFGASQLEDGTVETALNAVSSRLEKTSERVPLWVLPEYIVAQGEPKAESMGKVIHALCDANGISSKGDTETRSNKVKEIGELLLATPGLAEAMANYMAPMEFEKAFLRYVDKAKPELKRIAKRIGDSSHNYCAAVKNRFAETSSWLWSQEDAGTILEEVYWQMLSIESVGKIVGSSGYMSFEDALDRLRGAVLVENRVPTEFWAKKHPALKRFFELLNRDSLLGEDVKAFGEVLGQQEDILREVFFDIEQVCQLGAMQEIFGSLWPKSVSDGRELYSLFPSNLARVDEQSFVAQGRGKIEEYSRTLVSRQVTELWRERTGSKSPEEWSQKHLLPAECILVAEDAVSLVEAVENPDRVSADRFKFVHDELKKDGVFVDVTSARAEFLKRVLPSRYEGIGCSVNELSEWLCEKLGDTPNGWLTDERLRDEVEAFVKKGYDAHARKKAEEKVNSLSSSDAKKLLLKLIGQIPDVGLSVLERCNEAE